jgi:replicative DNA helicase
MSNTKELIEKGRDYLKAGLSVLPVNMDNNKKPTLQMWKRLQSQKMTEEELEAVFNNKSVCIQVHDTFGTMPMLKYNPLRTATGIGIITGAVSGNLEVIDVDTKHDTTGSLWDELQASINDSAPGLFERLVIARTISGGYHLYYRCTKIEGNTKLAGNAERETLIETRGEGGYVVAYPTPGYEYLQNTPDNIPNITPEERDKLLGISRSFTEVKPEPDVREKATEKTYTNTGKSPFEDYNERGDVITLLESHGWTVVNEQGSRINLRRPGNTENPTSGNFHTGLRTLFVWSSSTIFTPEKGYNPSQVFAVLETNGDYKEAYKKLLALGYGEPHKQERSPSYELKTERITIDQKDTATGEAKRVSSPGDTFTYNSINQTEPVLITSTGPADEPEILKAIKLIRAKGAKAYIIEGATELRDYRYELRAILGKYAGLEAKNGGLSDRDTDSFIIEVTVLSSELQPIDRDQLKKEFLDMDPVKGLGITGEALDIAVDKLTTTKEKAAQEEALGELLKKAETLKKSGNVKEALEVLESNLKEVKLTEKATQFSKLLATTTEEEIRKEVAELPDSLDTGLKIGGEELFLPGGALSVYAAPTNHGKTLLLINTALNVAEKYPDKKFVFFTYEENATAIIQYFLNTYVNIDLNSSVKTNRRLIKDYFKTGSTQYIATAKREYFEAKKQEFFQTLIETGRILVKYVDYSSEELNLAIRYLHKTEPNLGGVFIDYFQLLNLPGEAKRAERINNRPEEMKMICQRLNRGAGDTGLPVCLAAQFNRDATNLMRLHPTNIGEAGDIERIVNTLVGLWNMDKKTVLKGITEAEADEINLRLQNRNINGIGEGNMYLEILKSRELPTGTYDFLALNGNTGKIKNRESAGW